MTVEECSDANMLAAYELGPGYRLELAVADSITVSKHAGVVRLCVTRGALESDVKESAFGEILASLLLLNPREVYDREALMEYAVAYYDRLAVEEPGKLRGLVRDNIERLLIADIYPLIARIARLYRVFVWIRSSINEALSNPHYFSYLRSIARRAGVSERMVRATELLGKDRGRRAGLRARMQQIPASISLVSLVDASIVLEGLTAKPHPLIVDPLLLVRLDAARIATKLLDFEDQLFSITSVKKALDRLKAVSKDRVSPIRSVERIVVGGFKTAVVKKYRDITAVKWIVAVIASIPLPKPRLNPLSRLNAEYYYNRALAEKGFNVPNPLLVDPRRRMAAYEYVEGTDLAQLLQKSPVPPVYRELGATLAQLHSENIVLWDTNPSNFIDSPRGLYIVDLEQARRSSSIEEKAWDIALAAYFSAIYSPREAHTRAKLIAEGYLNAGGQSEVVEEASKPRYAIPFIVAVPPTVIDRIRKAIESIVRNQ
jgi:Kae1-associated kinase Bud32